MRPPATVLRRERDDEIIECYQCIAPAERYCEMCRTPLCGRCQREHDEVRLAGHDDERGNTR